MSYLTKPNVTRILPIVTALPPDQFGNDEPIQSYPMGLSAMRVTSATGFPEVPGDLTTSRSGENTGSQFFAGEKTYFRTFSGTAWSSWREMGGTGDGGGPVEWDDIINKPSQFPPSPHTHSIDDISGLQDELDSVEESAKNYTDQQIAAIPDPDWNDIQNKPSTFPPSSHTHAISDVNNLQSTLDSKEDLLDSEQKRHIYAGTTDPSPSLGDDGDIYLKYEV